MANDHAVRLPVIVISEIINVCVWIGSDQNLLESLGVYHYHYTGNLFGE
jgi:hypothetical protein